MRLRHPVTGYVLAALVQLALALITHALVLFVPTYSFPGVIEILAVALIAMNWGLARGYLPLWWDWRWKRFWCCRCAAARVTSAVEICRRHIVHGRWDNPQYRGQHNREFSAKGISGAGRVTGARSTGA